MNLKKLLMPSLNWLLVFVPVSIYLEFFRHDLHTWLFISSCLAIIPLAGWLGRATEHLAAKVGEGLGGFLNATFGNAAELIIAIIALKSGYYEVVKASITGSIIGNMLLVMGAAFFLGGLKHNVQNFNALGAGSLVTMLTLSCVALVIPALFHQMVGTNAPLPERNLSLDISVILLITYALGLIFSLRTHKHLFGSAVEDDTLSEDEAAHPSWGIWRSSAVLLGATAMIAWISEMLVGSVEHAAHAFGMSSVFVGVIVVAIVGNAAEHSTAVLVAMKNRMDLSLGIALGSSIQIALFVAPFLVILSYFVGPQPMDLVFSMPEVVAIVLATFIAGQIANDGKSNWFEGVQLLSVYLIIGFFFYFLPAS